MSRSDVPSPVKGARIEHLVWLVAVTMVAVFLTCLHLTTTAPFKLTTFRQLVQFEAVEPFQHRVLLPALVAGLQQVLPLGEKLLFGLFEIIGWIALIVLAHRALCILSIGRHDLMRRVLAFTVVIPMFMHLIAPDLQLVSAFVTEEQRFDLGSWQPRALFYYVYDLPAAVFTLAMTLLLIRYTQSDGRRYVLAYLLLFAVATVNRETTLFMLGLFALLFAGRMPWMRLLCLLALQSCIFVAIQWPLSWLFADNINPSAQLAGTQYEYHLWENLALLADPLYFVTFVARFSAGLYLPVLLWRRTLDRHLVCALVGFGLPLIGFALVAGRVQEQRIFIEIVPLIWLAAMQVIAARSAAHAPEDTRISQRSAPSAITMPVVSSGNRQKTHDVGLLPINGAQRQRPE